MSESLARPAQMPFQRFEEALVAGLPIELIRSAYAAAPGNEIDSGKFLSRESSSALAANALGFFLGRAGELPPLPHTAPGHWPATGLRLEALVRFPWSGGRHPCLDALVETPTALIGIESKRYEPFRPKSPAVLSEAYWRPVWGDMMRGYERVRDGLRDGSSSFIRLDAAQLVKHAFGLRTSVHRAGAHAGKVPVLYYVFAEPAEWLDGRAVSEADIAAHRVEIGRFADLVSGDEVAFKACSYREMLFGWSASNVSDVRDHAERMFERFDV